MPRIESSSDPSNGLPWFKFDVDTVDMSVGFSKANGLANFPDAAAGADLDHLPPNSRHSLKLSTDKPDEVHVLAVALDGTLEFVPVSEQREVYYAHLAWYDPSTGNADAMEFVE